MHLSLSLHELLALLDGDDALGDDRAWLVRNTFAAADCTVIQPALAHRIRALDPDGVIIHVQTYATSTGLSIYTAWTPITWRESMENKRLTRLNNSEWRREQDKKYLCASLVEEFVTKLHRAFGFSPAQYAAEFNNFAEQVAFDKDKLQEHINEVDTRYHITEILTKHETNTKNP